MLERNCNGPAVSKQLALAVEALDLADHWAGGRCLSAAGGPPPEREVEMDENVIEFRKARNDDDPKPQAEPVT